MTFPLSSLIGQQGTAFTGVERNPNVLSGVLSNAGAVISGANLTSPLNPPDLVPHMAGHAPSPVNAGPGLSEPPGTPFSSQLPGLDARMAATATATASRPSIPYLVGTAVANHIANARGVRGTGGGGGGGGGGTYTGPGMRSGSNALLNIARTQLGVPYVFGTENPLGNAGGPGATFDCSGFTAWAFGRMGVSLPHSAAQQSTMFPRVTREQLRPGDLVFYDYGRLGGASDHVAIYIGNGQQIAASSSASQIAVQPVDWSHFIWGGATPFGGGAVPTTPRNPQRPSRRTNYSNQQR